MVTHADGHSNPPDRELNEAVVPIAHQPEMSATGSRRQAKWFIGGALVVVLFAGGSEGAAVANHMQQISSAGSATSTVTALQQWWARAKQDFTDMRNASDDIDRALSRFRPGALGMACQHVREAAEVKLRSHLPSPDRKLTAELNAAIGDFNFASHLCLTAVAGSPANYDGEFLSLMAQANKHMRAAQDIIDQMLASG